MTQKKVTIVTCDICGKETDSSINRLSFFYIRGLQLQNSQDLCERCAERISTLLSHAITDIRNRVKNTTD